MNAWSPRRLGEVLRFSHGKAPTLSETGKYPVYGSNGVIGLSDTFKHENSLIIGRVGAYCGSLNLERGKYWATDNTIIANVTDENELGFLFYLLKVLPLNQLAGGSAQPLINQSILARIKVQMPDKCAQRKIAAVLGAYDDLIEANRRRIALLEKMAEELYREWFVRLRFPGHAKTKISKGLPAGWSLMKLREIVCYYIGGGWGEDEASAVHSDGAYVIRGTDMPGIQSGIFDDCPYRFHKPSNLKSRMLQAGDFVFEVSGGSKDQLLGRSVHVTELFLKHLNAPVMCASFCKQIRFDEEQVSPEFMRFFLKLYYDSDLVGIYQTQSTGISNYQFESFLSYQTLMLPPLELRREFDSVVKPLLAAKDILALQTMNLTRTRDLLLPRLISGKLAVDDLDIAFPPSLAAGG